MVRVFYFVCFALFGSILCAADDQNDCVIKIGSGRRSPHKEGSRLARGLSAVCLDLARVGIVTPDHYDAAQQHIESQLNQLGSYTPHSARAVRKVRQQVGQELERQKNVLSESAGHQTASSFEDDSDDDYDDDSKEQARREELQKLLVSMNIANHLLTQNAVRSQDAVEIANHEARINKRWAYLGAALGLGGITVSIIFGIATFI